MNIKVFYTALVLMGCATLTACPATSEQGISITATAQGKNGSAVQPVISGTDTVQTPLTEKDGTIYRSDGMRIQVEFAAINLRVLDINPCVTTASSYLKKFAEFVMPSAMAHGAEIEVTSNGIHLMDDEIVELSEIPLVPGTYCSATLSLEPGTDALPDYEALATNQGAALKDVITTDLSGIGVNLSSCFYYATQDATRQAAFDSTTHTCINNIREVKSAIQITVPFDTPVTVNAGTRKVTAAVKVRFDQWFEGITMDMVDGDGARIETKGTGTQIKRYAAEYPSMVRPFPDKNFYPMAGTATKPASPQPCVATSDLSDANRANVSADCTAELNQFITQLVANVSNPDSYEITLTAN